MKVFWAWQSDHPGKISRFVIRAALEEAVEELKQEKDIDEPPEESRRADLHLDHDTKDVTGMPSVAETILEKIEAASVFIGDVTPVGVTPPIKANEGDKPGRPLMNPNVAIEMGYALAKLTDRRVIGVLNLEYGDTSSLPFDISHKRWPIQYRLVDGATNEEIKAQQKNLKEQFVIALKGFIKTGSQPEAFDQIPPKIGKALFFDDGETLAVQRNNPLSNGKVLEFQFPHRSLVYLRVSPKRPLAMPLAVQRLINTISQFGAFGLSSGALIQENAYGVAMSNLNPQDLSIDYMTQHFRNGEIWGINADILRQGHQPNEKWVPAGLVEDRIIVSLQLYCEFMKTISNVPPPITVEAGVVGVKNRRLTYEASLDMLGKLYDDEVIHRAALPDFEKATRDAFVKAFAMKLHASSGVARPNGLYSRW